MKISPECSAQPRLSGRVGASKASTAHWAATGRNWPGWAARSLAVVLLATLVATMAVTQARAAAASPRSRAVAAIRQVFGFYADQAIRVVACETGGTFSVRASNHGVYLGLFQFGPYARATFGFDWTALGQTRAAWRYFKASHYRWTAWECQP